MSKRLLILLSAIVVAVAISSTAGATPGDPGAEPDPRIADGSAQRELDAARAEWKAYGAHAHYRLRIRTDCFCAPATRRARTIEVRDGRPVEPPPAHLRGYATVRRLFARVQEAIDDEVAGLTAEYGLHGVPETIFVDVSRQIVDEEHGVSIVRFRSLD